MSAGVTKSVKKMLPPNVYIFNKIKNNEADVDLLRNTFQSLDCNLKIIKDIPMAGLQREVETMVDADFTKYNYVVIVILDNTNKETNIWTSSDGEKFYLNGDLLNKLKANKTLNDKLILSIFQNNHQPEKEQKKVFKALCVYPLIDARIHAVGYGRTLSHQWESNSSSTFIRVLCEQIKDSKTNSKSIEEILCLVSCKVSGETRPNEEPESEFSQHQKLGNTRLGSAIFKTKGG